MTTGHPLELPEIWWSVDPGDINVGLVRWQFDRPIKAVHTSPDWLIDKLFEAVGRGRVGLVVYERFQLDGKRMGPQIGSDFKTPQLIGAIKHICRHAGVETVGYLPGNHKAMYRTLQYMPPEKALRDWVSYGHGPHAKDAECVGIYHVHRLRNKGRGY